MALWQQQNIRIKMALAEQARDKTDTVFFSGTYLYQYCSPFTEMQENNNNHHHTLLFTLILYVYTDWPMHAHVRVNLNQ